MNYNLNLLSENEKKSGKKKTTLSQVRALLKHTVSEKKSLRLAFMAMVLNTAFSLAGPIIIGYTVDHYVVTKQYKGLLIFSGIYLFMNIVSFIMRYLQTILMGTVGQTVLFNLRNLLFGKLQELPVDFFNQNKTGDLISRLNNDTDKLNQFFSHSLMQFVSNLFMMIGAAIFLLSINFKLGIATLIPALFLFGFNKMITGWVKRKNTHSLKSSGLLSAEVQESLNNFKVIVAFNRRDYFRKKFEEANKENYKKAVLAGLANNLFIPVYGLASHVGQLIVLVFGIFLIINGSLTIGLLISFLSYVLNFYNPLRQIAMLWSNFQVALAGWDRISQILALKSNLKKVNDTEVYDPKSFMSFSNVSFKYPNGTEVLKNINIDLEKGKTYAFVGPTGGGKTTTASLMSRLYDAVEGRVKFHGKDIRSFEPEQLVDKIGFILQEPILFSGTVKDNILYGNKNHMEYSNGELEKALKETGLESLLQRFEQGLETKIDITGDGVSLGQRQIIAFMRAVLRKPELLILDEATANIDTITEKQLEEILKKLPKSTTRVIIAHRLNTIENADEIFFVNANSITAAGSLDHAVNMLLHGNRNS